ncbi:CHAT domain-containing protein [Trichoderma sp. SZMC 28015]
MCNKFESTRDISYLDKAIEMAREAIEVSPLYNELWPTRLHILGTRICMKFEHTKTLEDLEEAILVFQRIIDAISPDATATIMFGWLLSMRCSMTGNVADLDMAINMTRDAIDIILPNDPNYPILLSILEYQLSQRHDLKGEMADIAEAIYLGRNLINATPPDHPLRAERLSHLARNVGKRYLSTNDIADLNEAISLAQEANNDISLNHSAFVKLQCGMYLCWRYQCSGNAADLEEAIYNFFGMVEVGSKDEEWWTKALTSLGKGFRCRYDCKFEVADINNSVIILRESIATMPIDNLERGKALAYLGETLHLKYSHTGATADYDETVCVIKDALKVTSLEFDSRLRLLMDLACLLDGKRSNVESLADIEQSILLMRHIIGVTPVEDPKRADISLTLVKFLRNRYELTGALRDLDEAIRINRDSLDANPSPEDNETRVRQLVFLTDSLYRKYHCTGALSNLEECILLGREAINSAPSYFTDRHQLFLGLGNSVTSRYERTNALEDLNEAILLFQECALKLRFIHTGETADLMEAISILQEAISNCPKDKLMWAALLNGLGQGLYFRYGHTGMRSDLDEAIRVCQDAINAIPAANSKRGAYMECLDDDLWNPEIKSKTLLDIETARQCFIDTLYHGPTKVPTRFFAGSQVLSSPDFIRYSKAYDVAKYTIDLIPFMVSHALQNSDKQSILSEAVGVSSIAAAIALRVLPANRSPFAAIECLETGRGLIGGSLFQQYEISTLKKLHPGLADSFFTSRNRLNSSPIMNIEIEGHEKERRKAEQQFADLLKTIRSKPGFQRFLLSASELDTLHAASDGPLVILNTCSYGCDALIIEPSGFRIVELPRLSQGLSSNILIAEYSEDLESPKTLAWIWDEIVRPVLDALGFTEPPTDGSWPHVWWIPTGVLTKFPLHAAGHHLRRSGETTLDRVISSYATSVKAVIHSRRREVPIAIEPLSLVAVAMELTEGHKPLIHAQREVDAIFNIFESKMARCHRPQPYKDDVLSVMKTCQIFHFAGHGETHLTDPLSSALLLRDWQNDPLTVASLLETDLSSNPPFLAYLSACGTGQIIDENYVDESIHLVNAFQLAGFRHVIGTLWSVEDELCVEIAEMTYTSLKGGMRDDLVSRGLHDAIRTLRDRSESRAVDGFREGRHAQLDDDDEELGRPLWIPYVHFGV